MFSVVLIPTVPQKPLILCKVATSGNHPPVHKWNRACKRAESPRAHTKKSRLWIKPSPQP